MGAYQLLAVLLVATSAVASAITTDDILNFALNLECLEAQFYSWAARGKGLSAKDRGYGPAPRGGAKALLGAAAQRIAYDIYTDELAHVRLLRGALGAKAVACPLIDIGVAFAKAGDLAFGAKVRPTFNPYGSDLLFYHGAFVFEDVGVTAYHGAIAALDPATASIAAGILAVEAYHGGFIRSALFATADEYVYPFGVNVSTIVGAISKLRTIGGTQNDQGLIDDEDKPIVAPADSNALAFIRTPAQVLRVVYLGGTTSGGFFPHGLNGNIK